MLRWSKATTMLIGAGGVVAAMSVPDVFELLVYTYTLWAPSIIPPLAVTLGPTIHDVGVKLLPATPSA